MGAWIDALNRWIIFFFYAALVAVGTLQVGARYLFGISFVWTEELAIALFMWIVFLGAGAGLGNNIHPRIDILVEHLPLAVRRAVAIAVDAMIAVALVVLIYGGLEMVQLTLNNRTAGLRVSVGYLFYLSLPVGMALMLLNMIRSWWRLSKTDHGS